MDKKRLSNHPEFLLWISSQLELRFGYGFPMKTIYDWWTDLPREGYVGRSLKSTQLIARHDEKNVVRTRWEIMGKRMILMERLTLDPPDHWVWEPHMLGIDMVHDFRLKETEGGKIALTIHSDMIPRGSKGRIMNLMVGWFLRKMMVDEWESADKAFKLEIDDSRKTVVGGFELVPFSD